MSAQDSDHKDSLDLTDHSDHLLQGPIPPDHRIEPDHHVDDDAPPPVPSSVPSSVPANQGRMVAAGLSVLTFAAIVLLGWMILRNPLWETRSTSRAKSSAVSTDTSPLIIGGILPLTGDAASYGIPYQKVAQLAQKEINAAGGIAGKQIEIEWEDGRCESETASLAIQKILSEKHIRYLIAGACSSEYLATAPFTLPKKIISFSPSATSPEISSLGEYIFRTTPSDALAGKVAAQYAYTSENARTAAVISERSDYANALRDIFAQEFTRQGGTIVYDEVFEGSSSDFDSIALAVKAKKPDLIYVVPQTVTPGVILVSALKNHQISAKLLTAEVLLIRDTVSKQAKVLEGVKGVEIMFDEQRPKTKKFFNSYKNEYGLEVNDPAYMSAMYDIMYLIKEAEETAGGDPDRVANYLHRLNNWQGAVGTISFDSHGDPTIPYAIRQITGGQAKLLEQYTPTVGQ